MAPGLPQVTFAANTTCCSLICIVNLTELFVNFMCGLLKHVLIEHVIHAKSSQSHLLTLPINLNLFVS